jgi:lysophospholipase L1-like esterase
MYVFNGTGATSAAAAQYTPNNAVFNYSDYCSVSVTSARARFSRPTADGQGLENTNPGARVRFVTNADSLTILLQYTNLLNFGNYNGFGVVLANGAVVATFGRDKGSAGPLNVYVNLGSVSSRTIEVVMPYCASVDFLGVNLPAGATLSAPAARPATKLAAGGDSITQGFFATQINTTWGEVLANAKGYQYVNHGYGGRQCQPADGTAIANLGGTMFSYLIGYNDFAAQLALATFKANYLSFLANFRAVSVGAKLYCITPIFSTNTNTLTLEMYRQQIRDALTSLGNPLNVLVEGLTLMTNNANRLFDGIHPNDTGAAEIAANLNSIVVP